MDVFKQGMLVSSLQGRDKEVVYTILAIEDDYLFLVNGKERLLNNPKKKKKKHVQRMNKIIDIKSCNDVQLKRKIKVALK